METSSGNYLKARLKKFFFSIHKLGQNCISEITKESNIDGE